MTSPSKDRLVVSLFDYTGISVKPWAEDGYTCYCYDLQHDKKDKVQGNITYKHANLLDQDHIDEIKKLDNVCFVSAFPVCTNTAVSGSAHFKKKGLDAIIVALQMFRSAIEICESFGCAFYLENPVSTVSTYWRKPDHYFHPYEYGGYLSADDKHPDYPDYIDDRDAYTKKTCLWTGNGFVMPAKKEVKPVENKKGYSKQFNRLGGSSEKTKNIRSATPRGFAKAVHLFNRKEN